METQLIQMALHNDNRYKPNARAKEIRDIGKQVSDQDHSIIVPTDKTNSFTVMQTDDYKQKVLKHLLKDGERNLKREIGERLIQAKE
jgi:hypothetical protein